jgi:tRNA-specific 2-thiouridylase
MMHLVDLPENGFQYKSCCSLADVEDARQVATVLGIDFHVFNFKEHFSETVIKRFISQYTSALTPNPCIDCNKFLKFGKFISKARELDFSAIATGHYARIEKSGDRFLLRKSKDTLKDQSYVLYSMSQSELGAALFPLGNFTKEEVRCLAEENGFINASKPDSQDICFVSGNNYGDFIEKMTGRPPLSGDFIDNSGNVVGTHKGLTRYTIGQRARIGGLHEPMFVRKMDAQANTITLCHSKDMFSKTLKAGDLNFIPFDNLKGRLQVSAKIRYLHQPAAAEIFQTKENEVSVEFQEPQRAVTPGQAVVFYDGDYVIGGGRIK